MTRPDRPRLQVSVTGRALAPAVRTGLARWLERAAPASVRGAVAVAVIGDRAIRRLNARYREVDAPTDVLSFPAAVSPGAGSPDPSVPRFLGDIAIASGVARRQAAEYRHSLLTELRILALHGLLHLLGYDHEHDDGRMRRAEDRLRRRAGLPRGLIARSVRPSTQA
jgi:probable rRNA maturation factor